MTGIMMHHAGHNSGFEAHPGDIGVVKVWDGALTLAQIQTEYANYKTRFGY
jgi:hypothetical protein